jgi:hypothetical protein
MILRGRKMRQRMTINGEIRRMSWKSDEKTSFSGFWIDEDRR